MNIQYTIVAVIIALAVLYAGRMLFRRARSFNPKKGCGDDCGCNGSSKKLPS